ncbi:MAG: hypothetical protein DRQ51_10525 [Gammaproteobacteria bacterium]|nr:MAG: hypothetical protein DRQ51_10525 [Gammaproteobacteria bacterium]
MVIYGKTIPNYLKQKKVIRTGNVTGQYAEWWVANKLNLKLAKIGEAGFDATSQDGKNIKYQIKGRIFKTDTGGGDELGAVKNTTNKIFDYFVAVIFNPDFTVKVAIKIPYEVYIRHALKKDKNSTRLILNKTRIEKLLEEEGVKLISVKKNGSD